MFDLEGKRKRDGTTVGEPVGSRDGAQGADHQWGMTPDRMDVHILLPEIMPLD